MELIEGAVSLRRIRYSDRDVLARLANNKKIWNNLRDMFPHPYLEKDAENFIDSVKLIDPPLNLAIEYQNLFAGIIGIVAQNDIYRKGGEIGYWIGEPYWNKGIGTIAVKLATKYAFEVLKLERTHAGVFKGNVASQRVLEKNGYKLEGIFRKAVFKNNKFLNELRYARLKEEHIDLSQ